MEGDIKEKKRNGCDTATTAVKTASEGYTQEQRDKIETLLQRMREHFQPLPPQLLTFKRLLPRSQGDPVELDVEWFYCASFLISREWNVEKAFAMMQDAVTYRAANKLDEFSQLPPAVSVRGWGDTTAVYKALGKAPRPVPGRADRIAAGMAQTLACGIHYWDKAGRVVVYVMIDSLDEPGMIAMLKKSAKVGQKPADVLWECLRHFLGVGEDLVLYQLQQQRKETAAQQSTEEEKTNADKTYGSNASSSRVTDGLTHGLITLVMDLKGFHIGLLWKPMLDLFRDVVQQLFKYYPDMVHRIIAVNAPGIVRTAFDLVKGVMPLDFQKKISFVAPQHTLAALKAEIEPEHIPTFLGGQCSCAENGHSGLVGAGCGGQGCVDGYDRNDPRRRKAKAEAKKNGKDAASTADKPENAFEENDDKPTEDISISAGQQHRCVFQLQPSETVVWDFAVSPESNDVAFTVYFVPQADSFAAQGDINWSKVDVKKLETHQVQHSDAPRQADAFTATQAGTLVLSWYNTRSLFWTRAVQLRVYKGTSQPSEEREGAQQANEQRDV